MTKQRTGIIALAIIVSIVVVSALLVRRLHQPIKEYPLSSTSEAGIVCVAPPVLANAPAIAQKRHAAAAGLLWFADRTGNKIGNMNSTGTVVEYAIPTPNAYPVACTFGPQDGLLYFAEHDSGKVAAFDPLALKFTEWTVPPPNIGLAGLAFDVNNILNILLGRDSGIQRMRTDGSFLAPIQLSPGRFPHGPAQCGGHIWFAENTANRIARLAPNGTLTETILPQPHSQPFAATCASDGVYFTEYGAGKIGRIDMNTMAITQWDVPSSGSNPMGIETGYDGNIYFAESRTNKIAVMPPGGGAITEYNVPTRHALPNKVTPCFSSAICFSERGAPNLGVLWLSANRRTRKQR